MHTAYVDSPVGNTNSPNVLSTEFTQVSNGGAHCFHPLQENSFHTIFTSHKLLLRRPTGRDSYAGRNYGQYDGLQVVGL